MSPTARTGSEQAEERGRDGQDYGTWPPPPRKGGILADSELLSGDAIKSLSAVSLFKTEPMLNRKCVALYVRHGGRPYAKCSFRLNSLREAPNTDPRDLAQALRRTTGSSSAAFARA